MITANTKTFIDILEELEKTTGTNDKIAIIKENADNAELKEFLRLALDKNVTFGIAEYSDVDYSMDMFVPLNARWNDFKSILYRLASRELTGNDAKKELDYSLSLSHDKLQNKWFIKCLLKDLASIGIGQTLFDKAYNEKTKFKLMLAEPESELDKVEDSEGWLDKKANGVRTTVFTKGRKLVTILGGRNGLEASNFYFIKEELELLLSKLSNENWVFDGEVHVNDVLEDTMSLYGFKYRDQSEFIGKNGKLKEKAWQSYLEDQARIDKLKADAKFVIFDMIDTEDWENQFCNFTLEERKDLLHGEVTDAIKELGLTRIEIIESEKLPGKDDARTKAQEWVAKGFEGGIWKISTGSYEWKRSRNWIKIKEEIDIDVEIIGFEISKTKYNPDGTPKADMLGKFLVRDAKGAEFGIGTGHYLSEEKRIEVWNNQELYLGKILKCTAQRGSKNSYACPRVEDVDWEADCLRIDKNEIE